MKDKIHPTYYPKAKASCACGAKFIVSSTKPEIKVEICHNCHPFYTGKEKIVDVIGKIERFKKRRAKAADSKAKSKTTKKAEKRKKKTEKKTKNV